MVIDKCSICGQNRKSRNNRTINLCGKCYLDWKRQQRKNKGLK